MMLFPHSLLEKMTVVPPDEAISIDNEVYLPQEVNGEELSNSDENSGEEDDVDNEINNEIIERWDREAEIELQRQNVRRINRDAVDDIDNSHLNREIGRKRRREDDDGRSDY